MPQLKWDWKNDFLQQLNRNLADDSLNLMPESYDAINLSNNEVSKKYPNGRQILRMAIKDGVIQKDSVANAGKKEYRQELEAYMKKHGYKP